MGRHLLVLRVIVLGAALILLAVGTPLVIRRKPAANYVLIAANLLVVLSAILTFIADGW